MNGGRIFAKSRRIGKRDAVIGSQRGTVGTQPTLFFDNRNRIDLEIHRRIGRFDTDHIGMPLNHHSGMILIPGGCRHVYHQIARVIRLPRKTVFFRKIDQISANRILFSRRSRNFRNFEKPFFPIHGFSILFFSLFGKLRKRLAGNSFPRYNESWANCTWWLHRSGISVTLRCARLKR